MLVVLVYLYLTMAGILCHVDIYSASIAATVGDNTNS